MFVVRLVPWGVFSGGEDLCHPHCTTPQLTKLNELGPSAILLQTSLFKMETRTNLVV